jgi:hypothetical protein
MAEQEKGVNSGTELRHLTKTMFEMLRLGPEIDDSGCRRLDEKVYQIADFSVVFYPNEGKHSGRPHCVLRLPNNLMPKVDIVSGLVMEGDAGNWSRSIKKFVAANSEALKAAWTETRPDTQKLPISP